MDVKQLFQDKRVVYGAVGVGAGAGLYVLYKKRQAGASGSSTTSTGTVASPASVDTSGQDIAQWLGQYGQNLQSELDAYQSQLTSTLTQLQGLQPVNPPTGGITRSPIGERPPTWWAGGTGSRTVKPPPGLMAPLGGG